MGCRLRRSLHLAPGIRVKLSKTGTSLSVGRRGATMNFSKRGTKATIGLPGSGMHYSTMLKPGPETALPRSDHGGDRIGARSSSSSPSSSLCSSSFR